MLDAEPDWRADAGPIVGRRRRRRSAGAWSTGSSSRGARRSVWSIARRSAPRRSGAISAGRSRCAWEERSRALEARRCSSTPPARACPAIRRWNSSSTRCRRPRSSPTSSTFRAKRHCWRPRESAATARSTGSACCCTRRARRGNRGSASIRRSRPSFARRSNVTIWRRFPRRHLDRSAFKKHIAGLGVPSEYHPLLLDDAMKARMKTSIATVSISGDLREKLAAIAAAGFDGVEIFENDFLAFDGTPAEVGRHGARPRAGDHPVPAVPRFRGHAGAAARAQPSTAPSASST